MVYEIVHTDPLVRPFPFQSFGLANVVSFDDAKSQIVKRHQAAALDRLANMEEKVAQDLREEIMGEYEAASEEEVGRLGERWPKVEPAFKLHIARQERRRVHFRASCRLMGCENPHGLAKRKAASGRKTRRWPRLFCGRHADLRGRITAEDYARLITDPNLRVKFAE